MNSPDHVAHPYRQGVQLSLAFIGTANWDIYVDDDNRFWSIPKPGSCPSCQASYFGLRDHIRRLMDKGYFADVPTELGLTLLTGLHSQLRMDSRGNRFTLLRFAFVPPTPQVA